MPPLHTYQLRFPGGLHIGTRGVDLEEAGSGIPSDTLFSAIVDAWSRTGGDVPAFIQPFLEGDGFDPPFLLSSAFPYVGELRFYPLPVGPERLFSPEVADAHSDDIREIRFFSEALFDLARRGQRLDGYLFAQDERQLTDKGLTLQHGELWLTREEASKLAPALNSKSWTDGELRALRYQRIWATERVPRVLIDRVDQSSNLFHAGRASFAEGCGLWFGIYWRNSEAKIGETTYLKAVADCLEILSGEGLGGERSTGYGAFQHTQSQDVTFDEARPGDSAYLLSRYSPLGDTAALTHPESAYRLVAVAGWFRRQGFAAQRRKRIMLVAEGSLVAPSKMPAGKVLDVAPDFIKPEAIYRSGLALAVRWPAREVRDA